jgi:UDP-glucose 4-epimerase
VKEGRPVVLLTGASGFIGCHLAPALKNAGWIVRRVVRRLPLGSEDVLIPSIDGETDWDAALRDVDAVVHLAARVHHPESDGEHSLYRSLNRDGTVRLAQCAAGAGIAHFIYMSTILVNGSKTNGHRPFREGDIPAPKGLYPISKAEAERGLATIADTTNLKITVIRPPLVYGPLALGNFRRLLGAIQIGLPLPFAGIRNRRAFVAIENLVSFITMRLGRPERSFEVFLIADNEQVSTPYAPHRKSLRQSGPPVSAARWRAGYAFQADRTPGIWRQPAGLDGNRHRQGPSDRLGAKDCARRRLALRGSEFANFV